MRMQFDKSVKYEGPRAEFASLTGSPFWGMSVQEVINAIREHGWTLKASKRLPTPYGLGPLVNHFTTSNDREVIWIPSYGMIAGEAMGSVTGTYALFWLLKEAGVKVILVGGTSGTNDWRDPQREETIKPGDFVLPWSFYRHRDMPGTLPGTELAMGLLPNLALMKDPFCTSLSRQLIEKANEELSPTPFRRVHHSDAVKVSLRSPTGGTFESEFETLAWRVLTKLISKDEAFPHVMLFGDCVNPALTRQLQAHLGYYHLPANWAEGHPAGTREELTETLDHLYLNVLPQVCVKMEVELLETMQIPNDCTCLDNLKARPTEYLEALTPV